MKYNHVLSGTKTTTPCMLNHIRRQSTLLLALAWSIASIELGQAQPNLTNSVPPLGASGVSPSASVVFTFDTAMDTNATAAQFLNSSAFPFTYYSTADSWNAAATVLTCTPSPAFPSNQAITWLVSGQDLLGNSLDTGGLFSTGTGGSTTTGSGTNAITTFSVGKIYAYNQSSTGAPSPAPDASYLFNATTALASNRTATAISLALPTAAVSNLTQNILAAENYYLFGSSTDSNAFETTFPQGTYMFTVSATASNQTVSVLLPTAMAQPNAPHISNFAVAQAIDASQPFKLSWDPFSGGTSTDYIFVAVGNTWKTPNPGTAGALNGTATSVTVPAGTLKSNSTTNASVYFYRTVLSSNVTYATLAYRASATDFNLVTTGTAASLPVLSNPAWSSAGFGFDIDTSPGQLLTVVTTTNCAQSLAQWQVLLTTNSPGNRVHITDAQSTSNSTAFYRVKNGS